MWNEPPPPAAQDGFCIPTLGGTAVLPRSLRARRLHDPQGGNCPCTRSRPSARGVDCPHTRSRSRVEAVDCPCTRSRPGARAAECFCTRLKAGAHAAECFCTRFRPGARGRDSFCTRFEAASVAVFRFGRGNAETRAIECQGPPGAGRAWCALYASGGMGRRPLPTGPPLPSSSSSSLSRSAMSASSSARSPAASEMSISRLDASAVAKTSICSRT